MNKNIEKKFNICIYLATESNEQIKALIAKLLHQND